MIVIKWRKIKGRKGETKDLPLYELYVCMNNNHKMTIGHLGWNNLSSCWVFNYRIPRIQENNKKYENYTIDETNDVLFRAVLDIQSDLSFINNMCVEYCNAISDYAIDYVQGVDHNED